VQAFRLLAAALAAYVLQAAPAIFPLKDIRAGLQGVGRTVFSGSRVEEFQVEILGVLENIGPKESIILARLKGGPLENAGVMQGMSGSPVYIDGRLAGAVALGFPMSKEAIAGIRPIEEMLRVEPGPKPAPSLASIRPRRQFMAGSERLEELATPVSFSGFTGATLEHFATQLRDLGLDPRQGVSGGGNPADRLGDPRSLEPGSMISVQLLAGDMSISADGTVTCIDGNRVYAFGHRFLAGGETELPFARAEVLALLPNLSSSFKISAAREWMGTITEDRNSAISGLVGRRAAMVPIEIRVGPNTYHMSMIQDRVMTPLVMQMAIFSTIDATGRTVGSSTFSVRGRLEFAGGSVRVDNVYSGDVNVAAYAALGVASPLTYALSSGFDALKLKSVALEVGAADRRSQMQIADLVAPRQARPGEDIELTVMLVGENGFESPNKVHYRLPVGAPTGPLYVTVSDATSTNLLDYQAAMGTPFHTPGQVLGFLNALRTNTKAYLRVWRAETAYTVEGRDLPDPPPSVALILGRAQIAAAGMFSNWRGSKLAEIEVPAGENVVTGSKSIQIEVKE
jgi:hypothetical protein